MINNYIRIINQIEDEITYWINDEEEDDSFNLGIDFMRFSFRTDDNLVYNQEINIPVCVMSLSSAIRKENIYYPNFK